MRSPFLPEHRQLDVQAGYDRGLEKIQLICTEIQASFFYYIWVCGTCMSKEEKSQAISGVVHTLILIFKTCLAKEPTLTNLIIAQRRFQIRFFFSNETRSREFSSFSVNGRRPKVEIIVLNFAIIVLHVRTCQCVDLKPVYLGS